MNGYSQNMADKNNVNQKANRKVLRRFFYKKKIFLEVK